MLSLILTSLSTLLAFADAAALIPSPSLTPRAAQAKYKWLSPEYNYFFQFPLPIPAEAVPITSYLNETTGIPIDYFEMHIKPFTAQAYPNLGPAHLVGYNGTAPGPTFRIQKGRESLVRFINEYDRPSSIHLHGSYSRAPFDGWAEDVTDPGMYKDYYYPNSQPQRLLWYHDHAIGITAVNAYFGQAGFYILEDPEEEARVKLPSGKYDIPLMLQSKQYDSTGDLVSPENERTSLYGDVFHVNGQPWPFLNVEPRKYRFRMVDASVSRAFHLFLNVEGSTTPLPFTVVGADAGLLSHPVETKDLYLHIAERWTIVIDFAPYAGKKVTLMNERAAAAIVDEDYFGTDRVMQFVVGTTVTDNTNNGEIPQALGNLNLPPVKTTPDHHFKFEHTNGQWLINGVGFEDVENRILAKPPRGSVELWELENSSGGWSHPVHVHLVDFQVVSRTGGRGAVTPYEAAALKDVVMLGRGETVRVLARYAPWDGVYMFHCHNLVHEDHDMMAAFNVTSLGDFGYPETTHFIDPMEERWRAKPYNGTNLLTVQEATLPFFSSLDAYAHVDEVEEAVIAFQSTHPVLEATPAPKPKYQ